MIEIATTWRANTRRVNYCNKHFEYPGWQEFPFQDERKKVLNSLASYSRREGNIKKSYLFVNCLNMSNMGKEVSSQAADKWFNEVTSKMLSDFLLFQLATSCPSSKPLSPKGRIFKRNVETVALNNHSKPAKL